MAARKRRITLNLWREEWPTILCFYSLGGTESPLQTSYEAGCRASVWENVGKGKSPLESHASKECHLKFCPWSFIEELDVRPGNIYRLSYCWGITHVVQVTWAVGGLGTAFGNVFGFSSDPESRNLDPTGWDCPILIPTNTEFTMKQPHQPVPGVECAL